jgi:hypothetical protein
MTNSEYKKLCKFSNALSMNLIKFEKFASYLREIRDILLSLPP